MFVHDPNLSRRTDPSPVVSRPATPGFTARVGTPAVVRRATVLAGLIDSALTLVNQWDALFAGAGLRHAVGRHRRSQALGQGAFLSDVARRRPTGAPDEPVWRTAAAHGIAPRALVLGLAVGSLLSPLIAALAAVAGHAVPWGQVAQVYALPLVFGVLSQALSYRRARAASAPRPVGPVAVHDLVGEVYGRRPAGRTPGPKSERARNRALPGKTWGGSTRRPTPV